MSIFNPFKKKASNVSEGQLCDRINALAKNEIGMEMVEEERVIRPDACKIGGKPYLPANFEWPRFQSTDDELLRPLSFFCQINLAEVKPYDKDGVLPENGMLYFFYECESSTWGFDPADKGAARVFYFENVDGFVSLGLPNDLAEEYTIPEIAVKFQSQKSYPSFEEFEIYGAPDCDWDAYDNALGKLGVDVNDVSEYHKLLGYADVIQGEMLTECERVCRGLYCGDAESYENTPDEAKAEIAKHAGDWTLLLQISTITKGDFEWMFGDCGMLYFYIRKDDLAARNFDQVQFSLQCG